MRLSPLFWESVQPLHFPLWLDQRLSLRLGLHLSRTLIFLMHAETTNFTNLTNYFWRRYSLCTQPTDAVRRVQRLCVIYRCCASRTGAVHDPQRLCAVYSICGREAFSFRSIQPQIIANQKEAGRPTGRPASFTVMGRPSARPTWWGWPGSHPPGGHELMQKAVANRPLAGTGQPTQYATEYRCPARWTSCECSTRCSASGLHSCIRCARKPATIR